MPRVNAYLVARWEDTHPDTIRKLLRAHAGEEVVVRVYRRGRVLRDAYQGTYDLPGTKSGINRQWKDNGWYFHWVTNSWDSILVVGDEIRIFAATRVQPRRRAQRFASGVTHCVFTPIRAYLTEKFDEYASQATEMKASKGKVTDKIIKEKSRYKVAIDTVDTYEERYVEGMPEDKFQEFVDEIGKKVNITIQIVLPMSAGKLLEVRSAKGSGTKFVFMNTRLDHVDLNKVTNTGNVYVMDTRDEMKEMAADLDSREEFYTFRQSNVSGITSISTLDATYQLNSDYYDAVREFEQSTGLEDLKIDAVRDPMLSDFVLRGCHMNITAVTPHGDGLPSELREMHIAKNHLSMLRNADAEAISSAEAQLEACKQTADAAFHCLDIKKSYASFHLCRFYSGFPHKLTDLRPTDKIMGEGFYLIDNLDFSKAHPVVRAALQVLGHPYQNMNVYPKPDLTVLMHYGISFDIREGCWSDTAIGASGEQHKEFDFRFPGEPATDASEATGFYRKDGSVSFYAKWVGQCRSVNTSDQGQFKSYWMKGTREYFENLSCHLSEDTRVTYYVDGAARIQFPARSHMHLSQITAYIQTYERLHIFMQLMHIVNSRGGSISDIVWIDKDDITVRRGNDFTVMPYMAEKRVSEKTYAGTPNACYVSGIWQQTCDEYPFQPLTTSVAKYQGGLIACVGPGGTGKTHDNCVDTGLCGGVVFVAPSHELCVCKRDEYGMHTETNAAMFGPKANPEDIRRIVQYNSTAIFDEMSEWTDYSLRRVVDLFKHMKIIICGDPGYQLPPIHIGDNLPMTVDVLQEFTLGECGKFTMVYYTKSHRCKCSELLAVLTRLRDMIDHQCTEKHMRDYIVGVLEPMGQVITFDECVRRFNMEDAIICSKKTPPFAFTEEYTTAIIDRMEAAPLGGGFYADGVLQHRYRVHPNAPNGVPNGRIIFGSEAPFPQCEETYASTIHAFQGKTCENNLYIDLRHMFERQHWYTALSRARYLDKVFIVDVPMTGETKEDYMKTVIYKIWSPHTSDVYIGHTTKTAEERMRGHLTEFRDTGRTKRCSSYKVIAHGDAQIEVLEEYPCKNVHMAKAREADYIRSTPHCINENIPGGKRKREEM